MSSVSKNKEIAKFVKELVASGMWSILSGSKHQYHMVHVSGWKCPIPSTPSDGRAYLNFKTRTHRVLRMIESGQSVPCRIG